MSVSRKPSQWSPPQRQLPTGWRALVIGIAFGFSAGFLFTIGIISLINANNTIQTASPVGNSAASASATAVPTSVFTPNPSTAITPTSPPIPTTAPTSPPVPTIAPTASASGPIPSGPDQFTFYFVVTLIFLILSAFVLLRAGGKK
jgi:hypothetical protein